MAEDKNDIIFILIATDKKPLASYREYSGDWIQTCEKFLSQVKQNASSSVNFGDFFIFYCNQDNITYLVMTRTTFPKVAAVALIESLRKELHSSLFNRDFDNINEYGLDGELKEKLKMKFEYYNQHPEITSESLAKLKIEIEKMKDEVFEANEQLLIRGEKVVEMESKAGQLVEASSNLQNKAHLVKTKEKKSRIWVILGLILLVLIIVYIIIAMVCSWDFKCS